MNPNGAQFPVSFNIGTKTDIKDKYIHQLILINITVIIAQQPGPRPHDLGGALTGGPQMYQHAVQQDMMHCI